MVWGKIEDFAEGRTGGPAETEADGIDPNQPCPSGLRLTDALFAGLLGR